MRLDHLPFNRFDVLVVLLLLLGTVRGRKRGLSAEVFTMMLWLVLVVACALTYMPLGDLLSSVTPFSHLFCYIACYLGVALLISLLFLPVKRALGGKVISADSFGTAEYYVGMPAGAVRFLCILIAALALLNARYYSRAEIVANEKYQKEMYGSEFFPGLNTLQHDVFAESLSGPIIREYLEILLIKPTPPERKQLRRAEEKWM
jgi:uncharacterized membrane protein required for colicin V production